MPTPWHKRGVRVPRWAYRAWYIAQLIASALLVLSAVAPVALLVLDTVTDVFASTIMAIAGVVTALIGGLMGWLAIHRLRRPVTARA